MSTNQKISGCGFHHVAIWTANWDESIRFYTEGLGFTEKIAWGESPKRAVMLDTGDGNYLEIFEREGAPTYAGEAPILHLCFRSENVENAFKTAILAGGKEKLPPTVPDPFTKLGLTSKICFIEGPSGEVVEFFQSPDL